MKPDDSSVDSSHCWLDVRNGRKATVSELCMAFFRSESYMHFDAVWRLLRIALSTCDRWRERVERGGKEGESHLDRVNFFGLCVS